MQNSNGSFDTDRAAEMYQAGRNWAQSLKAGDVFRGSHGEARHRGLDGWEVQFFGCGALFIIQDLNILLSGATDIIHSITERA